MTFCDKLDSDEEFDLLRGWLSNSPHAHDAVPLVRRRSIAKQGF